MPIPKGYKFGKRKLAPPKSLETRIKLSNSHKKRVAEGKSHLWKGGKPKCKDCGKICSEYINIRCRKCNDKFSLGENAHNWQGGKTNVGQKIRATKNYKEWRLSVLKRDKYKCAFCNVSGGKLIAHHIVLFSKNIELRMDIKNGLTLHDLCHRKLHKFFNDFNKRLYE